MCRWFAYISPEEPCLLSDVLIDPANSVSKQCSEHYLPQLLPHGEEKDLDDSEDKLLTMRNSLLNMDGLGIAFYTNTQQNYKSSITGMRPALYKTQSPPFNDFNFRSLCTNTESLNVLAHIRAATSVVSQPNCHPFVFGRHTFMHNGAISDFNVVRRDLTDLMSYDAFCNVLGTTDSENIAALYITNLTAGGGQDSWEKEYSLAEMRAAMVKAVVQIMETQKAKLGDKTTPNSLNLCTSDGRKMVAIRFRNHATEQPPSLYWSEFAGRTLNHKYPGRPDDDSVNAEASKADDECGKHTIIASEPTTYDMKQWHLIGANHSLTVDEFGTEVETPIEYDRAKLDAKSAS